MSSKHDEGDWNYWLAQARKKAKDEGLIIGENEAPHDKTTKGLHDQETARRTLHAPTGFMLTERQSLFMDKAIKTHPRKWNMMQKKLLEGDKDFEERRREFEAETWKMFKKETESP